jgi:hypothetical protein
MSDTPEPTSDFIGEIPAQKKSPTPTWVKVLAAIGIVAVFVCFLLPGTRRPRVASRRSQSKNNMKQLGLALHNYHDAFLQLPMGLVSNLNLKPEARLSWIVSILPGLDQAPLYREIDQNKGWNDAANAPHTKFILPSLLNPANKNDSPLDGFGVTHYVGIAGVGTDAAILPLSDKRVGAFGYDRNVRFEDITDGLSNTMFVTDASRSFGPWSRGGTATIRALTTKPYINGPDGIGGPHFGIIQVLLGDGAVRAISVNIDPSTFEALATIHGGEVIGEF